MIRNFADHSANERTYLAWVRTAVAIMGFGFVVERLGVTGTFTAPPAAWVDGDRVWLLLFAIALPAFLVLRLLKKRTRLLDVPARSLVP